MSDTTDKTFLDGPRLLPRSGGIPRQLIVILHGYGADGSDLIDLGRVWQNILPDAAFVAPNAPEDLPFEGFGGRQWFALDERTPEEFRIGAEAAQSKLCRFLDQELSASGLDERSLALIGFSQGAMMTFQVGLHRIKPPAALIAYSGLCPGINRLGNINTHSPVLIVHGADDDVVPAYHLEQTKEALKNANVAVEAHMLDGLGHSIDERGLALASKFLERAFDHGTLSGQNNG